MSALSSLEPARLDTAQDLAKCLNISTAYVRQLTRTTDIPAVRIGHAVRYDRGAVLAWLAAGGPRRNGNGKGAAEVVGDEHKR